MHSFQNILLNLQKYWADWGCALLQPYDLAMGAGTFHPATVLRTLGPDPWNAAYVQPCRRPTDGRFGENPNRLQHYYQFQVILKPAPENAQELYLRSLEAIGMDITHHDIRFVEDDWESPTLGAAGLGWEVWCDGTEITQFTYFQQVGGITCDPVSCEITYGLDARIAPIIQGVENVYQLNWNGQEGSKKLTYHDIFHRAEQEFSHYNFSGPDTSFLFQQFQNAEQTCEHLLMEGCILPAYDQCIQASHIFNLLDARGVISVAERAHYIGRIRHLARNCCHAWVENSPVKTKED